MKRSRDSRSFNNENKTTNKNTKNRDRLNTTIKKEDTAGIELLNEEISQFDEFLTDFLSKFEISKDENKNIKEESRDTSIVTDSICHPICSPEDESVQELNSWLKNISMEEYSFEFLFNGYDNIKYLKEIITADDLNNMGIKDENDIYIILDNVNNLPNPPSVNINSREEFDYKYLLNICELNIYEKQFIEQEYGSYDKILKLGYFSLVIIFNIKYIGHRKRIILFPQPEEFNMKEDNIDFILPPNVIDSSTQGSHDENLFDNDDGIKYDEKNIKSARPSISSYSLFNVHRDSNHKHHEAKSLNASVEEVCHDSSSSTKKDKDDTMSQKFSKKFGTLKKIISSKTKNKEATLDENVRKKMQKNITIPKISENSSGYKTEKISRVRKDKIINKDEFDKMNNVWIHSPSQLFVDSIVVECMFLGMHQIIDVKCKGKSMVHECVEKLKLRSANQTKMPSVLIKISAFDVTIKNKINDSIICVQKIPNILFCSQDRSDQRVFCYVYYENKNNKFLCNVFRCNSVKLSAEAVLAIGYAFQLYPEP